MSERLAGPDGAPTEAHARLYRRWAEGGAALLITGNVMIDARAIGESGNVVLEDDRALGAFTAWAAAAAGAALWMQLNHPGRQSPRTVSREPVAPSAVPMRGTAGLFAPPRALAAREIEQLIARFARSAVLARDAGFAGVEIHAAHGYLVSQFLSPHTNRRDDDWGGDPERRRRFLIEVVRAVRRAVPRPFSLGIKLNSADFQRGGFGEEESLEVVAALDREDIDLLEISGGTYEAAAMFDEPSTRAREAFFLDYAEKARAATRVPLMVTGGFRSAAGMNAALARGALDLIGLARPLAVEPDLPRRLIAGEVERAREIKLATGWKKLDALVQGAWYQQQLDRLARGTDADPKLCRLSAAVRYLRDPSRGRRQLAA